jgi:XRE family transcriptional regulator, fatty acid utilization regulator
MAKSSPPTPDNSSINIGFPIDDALRQMFRFIDDPAIPETFVGETCERCPMADCEVRAAPPTVLIRQQQTERVLETIGQLRK